MSVAYLERSQEDEHSCFSDNHHRGTSSAMLAASRWCCWAAFRAVCQASACWMSSPRLTKNENITDLELGRALGLMGRPPDPDAIREGPAGSGVAELEERLLGLRALMTRR